MVSRQTLLSQALTKYHRDSAISLLCSEWEEVGHTELDHQETTKENLLWLCHGEVNNFITRFAAGKNL